VAFVAALLTGAVFVVAGVTKMSSPSQWRSQANGLRVPGGVAVVVPYIELALGALLMVQVQRPAMAWVAVVVLLAFSTVLARQLSRGLHPPCACFGSLSARPIGASMLVRNGVLLAVALVAALA
jgi:uncharacterized membrane protein YphA (DoxX/SURF4 family)